ncbi:MAG: cobalamin B12-binding domain-containing protein [Thermoanaerobaculia bacterium]
MKTPTRITELSGPLLVALLAGDERGTDDVFRLAIARGADPALIARDLVQPALDEVGLLWERGEIGIAEEHLATALVSRTFLMRAACEKAPSLGAPRLVLTCLAGEFHELGARLAAEIGRREGWQVELLGANVPRDAALDYIALREPEAVGLSLSLAGHVAEAAAMVHRIRTVAPGAKVLAGGVAFRRDPALADLTGADACIVCPVALRDWLRANKPARRAARPPALRKRPRSRVH